MLLQLFDWLRYVKRRRTLNPAHALGRYGEDLAHRYLQRRGYRVVARNFVPRSGHGDLDLVAWQGDRLVIVEVKTRTSAEYGDPDRAIDAAKQHRLLRVAREYARRSEVEWQHVRFDVVSIVFQPRPKIWHEQDVFSLLG